MPLTPQQDTITEEQQQAEAFEFGEAFQNSICELYRLAIAEAERLKDSKDALRLLQDGVKYKPQAMIRAKAALPEIFEPHETPNFTDMLAAFKAFARCKEDSDALNAWDHYKQNTLTLEEFGDYLKEHYRMRKPRQDKCETCQPEHRIHRARILLESMAMREQEIEGSCPYCAAHDYPVDSNGKRMADDDVSDAAEWNIDHSETCPYAVIYAALGILTEQKP